MNDLDIYSTLASTVPLEKFNTWFQSEVFDLVVALAKAEHHGGQLICYAEYDGDIEVVPETWAAHQPIIGWVNLADGTFHQDSGRLIWPMEGSHRGSRGIGETFTSYSLLRIKARQQKGSTSRFALLAATTVEDIPDTTLAPLRALVEEYTQPITVETKVGVFTFNRELDCFDTEITWGDHPIDVTVEPNPDIPITTTTPKLEKKLASAVTFLTTVLDDRDGFDATCRNFAATKLLGLANEWRDDVAESMGEDTPAPEITPEVFASRLDLRGVFLPYRGRVQLEYDDGYMFGGHGVTVNVTKTSLTPTSAEMG